LTLFDSSNYNLEAQPTEPVSLTRHFAFRKLYTEQSMGAFYQISIDLNKRTLRF
jgi:hypothetical protein